MILKATFPCYNKTLNNFFFVYRVLYLSLNHLYVQPKLLLCVEDDEDDCVWIEEASAEIDPRLVFVAKSNGKEALMFLHRQKEQNFLPCLILLDLNMTGMDGKQTLVEIKK
ncbi:MAG: hypothetical protein ACXWV9_10840 [Flavisolibacter sp.]